MASGLVRFAGRDDPTESHHLLAKWLEQLLGLQQVGREKEGSPGPLQGASVCGLQELSLEA